MSQDFKITLKRTKLSARYRYIIFPFTSGEFQNALARTNLDYIIAPPPQVPPPPLGAILDWAGSVAKKGNIMLEFDSLPQIIRTQGSDPIETVNVFSEVLDIVITSLEPTIDEYAHFYEFISNYSIEIGKNPLEILGKIKPEGGLNEKIKDIIQEPVSAFSFHVCSPSEKIENSNWFDLNIRPTTRRSDKTFDVVTVYRNKDKSKVEKFVSNYDDNIRRVFNELK